MRQAISNDIVNNGAFRLAIVTSNTSNDADLMLVDKTRCTTFWIQESTRFEMIQNLEQVISELKSLEPIKEKSFEPIEKKRIKVVRTN